MSIFRKKEVSDILDGNNSENVEKTLGALDVTLMSIGATIGTGVMVLTGLVASTKAGPAVVLSFIASAIVCSLVALCYAEFAASIPSSGSAYSYIYVSLGEIVAHLVGWSLIAGYTVSTAAIAGGWSAYFNSFLNEFGIHLPAQFVSIPSRGGIVNVPAILVMVFVSILLSRGTKESKAINNIMVVIKLGIIALFLAVGAPHINAANWHPFMPFGVKGVFAGAASVFFAFTGFDAVSTSAEEVKNPQRDLPIGIVCSLSICTIIYVVVCIVLTGVAHYTKLNVGDAMSYALVSVGQSWAASLLSIGAVIGIISVLLAFSFGASRVMYTMSRDGLLPKPFSKTNSKATPVLSIWVVGLAGASLAGVADLTQLVDLANITLIGTFLLVSFSVIVLRKTHPNIKRSFKVPFVPVLPALAVLTCLFLMLNLTLTTWLYFGAWLAIGTAIYFGYSRKHSNLQNQQSKMSNSKEVA